MPARARRGEGGGRESLAAAAVLLPSLTFWVGGGGGGGDSERRSATAASPSRISVSILAGMVMDFSMPSVVQKLALGLPELLIQSSK